jgi:hypothetical protein
MSVSVSYAVVADPELEMSKTMLSNVLNETYEYATEEVHYRRVRCWCFKYDKRVVSAIDMILQERDIPWDQAAEVLGVEVSQLESWRQLTMPLQQRDVVDSTILDWLNTEQ